MKDPYLKPVIFGALIITILSLVFLLGIFLWAAVAGYATVRLANKSTKEVISYMDGILISTFTGIVGGAFLDLLTMISFNNSENKRSLIRVLEKSWPKEMPLPDFNNSLPTLFFATCIFIVVVCVVFSVIGGYIGVAFSKKSKVNN